MGEPKKKPEEAKEPQCFHKLPSSWQELQGHEQARRWFQTAISRNRLGSTFLFVGKEGIGKRTFAKLLAKSLFCESSSKKILSFCGQCPACVQVDAGTHPDLIEIGKPADKSSIPVELLIGPPEARMRQGLCHDIRLKAYYGGRKVAILDDADLLQEEGSNCLLKTLEEPPPGSVLILVGTSEQRQLPTIRSRSQIVRFRSLSIQQTFEVLKRIEPIVAASELEELARSAGGSVVQALQLQDGELRQFRQQLFKRLSASPLDFVELSKAVSGLAERVGKDAAAAKRDRLKIVFQFGEHFYKQLLLVLEGQGDPCDETLDRESSNGAKVFRGGRTGALACWQRCLAASEEVDRFVNQQTLVEAWASDLARFANA